MVKVNDKGEECGGRYKNGYVSDEICIIIKA